MGVPAHAQVVVAFKKETPQEFSTEGTLKEALLSHYETTSGKERSGAHISITELEWGTEEVSFTLDSPRMQNTEWQLDMLVSYLKDNYPDEVVYFSSVGLTYVDDMCHYFDGEDEWKGYIED